MTKQEIVDLLSIIIKCSDKLGPNQVKELYRIAIFCGFSPICPGCKKPIDNIGDFSWDHIFPRSKGGKNVLENMQPMHKECNSVKSNIITNWQDVCAKHAENGKHKKKKNSKKGKEKEIEDSMKKINSYLNDNHHNHKHK